VKRTMSSLTQRNKLKIRGEAICPKCGSIGIYEYILERPLETSSEEKSDVIEINYTFRCLVCNYKERKKILVSLQGLYPLRHLLNPEVKVFLEKIYLVSKEKDY